MGEVSDWSYRINAPIVPEAVDPDNWGPPGWSLLVSVVASYPLVPTTEDETNVKNFFNSFQYVIPCGSCKEDFKRMIKQDDISRHTYSRVGLMKWLLDKYNQIQMKLGKKQLTLDEFLDRYLAFKRGPVTIKGAQAEPLPNEVGLKYNKNATSFQKLVRGIILGALLVGVIGGVYLFASKNDRNNKMRL